MGKSSQLPSPGSVTPVMPWRTPWTPREVHHAQSGQNREFDSVRAAQGSVSSTSSRAVRGGKRQPQLPGGMEQERLVRGQQQRQLSLELLEVKALNRALSLQFRQGQYEIADMAHKGKELQRSNSALLTRIDESRALLDQFRREERRLSDALAKQAVLLMTEREARRNAEEEVERCRMALGAAPISSSSVPPVECSSKSGTAISNVAAEGSKATDSPARSKSSASDTTDNGPSLPELSAKVRLSLTGTVSTWIMDMQAACSSEIKEALVLPWLLQKLFYLCTELIEDRREDLVDLYLGGGDGAEHDDRMSTKLSAEASEFLHRHLRRHHKTLFPLSGPGQRIAIDKIMMALAYRCGPRPSSSTKLLYLSIMKNRRSRGWELFTVIILTYYRLYR